MKKIISRELTLGKMNESINLMRTANKIELND